MTKKKYAPTKAFHDGDPIVYSAAFSVEKTRYRFVDGKGKVVSPTFLSAKGAKKWLEDVSYDCLFDEVIENDYVRQSMKVIGTEEDAITAAKKVIAAYKKAVGKTVRSHKFYLTRSGHKHKTVEGTELRYQYNREGSVKPKHYAAVKAYLEAHPEFSYAPEGFEADNILCLQGQRHGEDAVVTSLDKDMAQMENAWFVHMNKKHEGKPVWCTEIGTLEHVKGSKYKGTGFKWLAYQAVAGDMADGYKGVKGLGGRAVMNLIGDLETKEDIAKTLLAKYTELFGDSYTYESWDGKTMTVTPIELLNQHFNLAYMEKSSKDEFRIEKYL